LLHSFGESIGLKVNFSKSFIVPINVGEEKVSILAGTLGCLVEAMPFTYLELPHGTTKAIVQDFLPVLYRIEKRIMGIASFTPYSDRLTHGDHRPDQQVYVHSRIAHGDHRPDQHVWKTVFLERQ
jgi:hypothetical protein